jgi:hypothetical protein
VVTTAAAAAQPPPPPTTTFPMLEELKNVMKLWQAVRKTLE